MIENDITTHVVAIMGVVKKGDKYLLARRSFDDPQAGGQWSFPSGKIDSEVGKGIVEETLKREIMEEVGLEIEDNVEFLCNDGFVRVSGHHVIMMIFLCFYKSGEARPLEDQAEVKWLTLDQLMEMKNELPKYIWEIVEALIGRQER